MPTQTGQSRNLRWLVSSTHFQDSVGLEIGRLGWVGGSPKSKIVEIINIIKKIRFVSGLGSYIVILSKPYLNPS